MAALVWLLYGTVLGRAFARSGRILLAGFLGVVDLQVVLGLALWLGGRRPAGVVGHLVLMLLAAAALHTAFAVRRRRPGGHGIPLAGVAVALAVIMLGILAIGRDVV